MWKGRKGVRASADSARQNEDAAKTFLYTARSRAIKRYFYDYFYFSNVSSAVRCGAVWCILVVPENIVSQQCPINYIYYE